MIGLAEFMLWPDFWLGTEEEVKQAVSHAVQLVGMLVGQECQKMGYVRLFQEHEGSGGASVAGWQVRVLNYKQDPDDLVSLSSNQFTPVEGVYVVRASAPVVCAQMSQLRLRDVTQTRTALVGTPVWTRPVTSSGTHEMVWLAGRISTDGTLAFELQHYCQYAYSPDGLGVDANSGEDNVFAVVELFKLPS
jgi:hypothetical protein